MEQDHILFIFESLVSETTLNKIKIIQKYFDSVLREAVTSNKEYLLEKLSNGQRPLLSDFLQKKKTSPNTIKLFLSFFDENWRKRLLTKILQVPFSSKEIVTDILDDKYSKDSIAKCIVENPSKKDHALAALEIFDIDIEGDLKLASERNEEKRKASEDKTNKEQIAILKKENAKLRKEKENALKKVETLSSKSSEAEQKFKEEKKELKEKYEATITEQKKYH